MNPRVSVFIATSTDGFIARENGDVDWLNSVSEAAPEDEDYGFQDFMRTVDVLVMGRNTFEKVLSFGGEWPYGETPVVVLSRKSIEFPPHLPESITHSSEPPRVLCERLSREGVEHVYLDGGVTIQRFLCEGLVDEMTITLIPVLLGQGIPLFGPSTKDLSLQRLETTTFDSGLLQMRYAVETS